MLSRKLYYLFWIDCVNRAITSPCLVSIAFSDWLDDFNRHTQHRLIWEINRNKASWCNCPVYTIKSKQMYSFLLNKQYYFEWINIFNITWAEQQLKHLALFRLISQIDMYDCVEKRRFCGCVCENKANKAKETRCLVCLIDLERIWMICLACVREAPCTSPSYWLPKITIFITVFN